MEKNTILSNAEEQNTPQENEISITEGKKRTCYCFQNSNQSC